MSMAADPIPRLPDADPPAVAALYRTHFGYVWQVVRKLGVNASAAEDATHDVFMVVHRKWRDFAGRSTTRTWLFGIARRIAYRYRRTDRRVQRRHAALLRILPAEPVGPDGFVERREAWRSLLAFLEQLDEGRVDHQEVEPARSIPVVSPPTPAPGASPGAQPSRIGSQ